MNSFLNFLNIIFLAIFLTVIGAIVFFTKKRLLAKSLHNLKKIKLLSIVFPYSGEDLEAEESKAEIEKMTQFLSLLSNNKSSFIFEIALANNSKNIQFYIAVSQKDLEYVIKSAESLWPEIQIKEAKDYNVFNSSGKSFGGNFILKRNFVLPLNYIEDFKQDPLGPIVSAFGKLQENGEGLAFQLVVKSAGSKANKFIRKISSKISNGMSLSAAINETKIINKILKVIFNILKDSNDKKNKDDYPKEKETDQQVVELLNKKSSQPLFKVNVRLISSAPTLQKAEIILENLKNSFSQFNRPNGNSLEFKKPFNLNKFFADFSWRRFDPSKAIIISAQELSCLWHPPILSLKTPELKKVRIKELPPAQNLPEEGLILGKNTFRGEETIVRLLKNDRRRHLYIIGQTGTGKSGFMFNLAKQDIVNGEGVAILDPHGDLINDLLSIIPKERFEDVILFDPGEIEWPVGLNMLEYDPQKPEQKTFIINELVEIFDQLYNLAQTGGPMFEQYLRNSLMLLMDDPAEEATLVEVPRVFSDANYRHYLLDKCKNALTVNFWLKEAEKAGGEASLANIVPYITSKFNVFLSNDYLRPIIAQKKSSFNFREIIDKKKIFLVNLSKGKLGEINSRLLGMLVVGKLFMAALSRVDIEENKRVDFYLYLDEFQNVTTRTISQILSEARKYRLSLTLAHQFIAQIDEKISNAVFGNVGNKVIFRISTDDAKKISSEFEPFLKVPDFIQLDNFHAYVSLIINGQIALPFNIATFPPEKGDFSQVKTIKLLSQKKYSRSRQMVEKEIMERSQIKDDDLIG